MSTFIQEQREAWVEPPVEKPKKKKSKITLKKLICNGTCRRLFFVIFFSVSIPALVYFYVFDDGVFPDGGGFSCLADEQFKVPCGKLNISAEECYDVNCCFNLTTKMCYHFLPSKYYYKIEPNGTYSTSQKTSPFNSTIIQNLNISVFERTEDVFSITLHETSRKVETNVLAKKNYIIDVINNPLGIQVKDNDSDIVLSTVFGPLIASEYYWEWSVLLTNDTLFGLDRNVISFTGNESLTKVIYKSKEDHMTLPVFWAYQNGKFNGLVIKHDGPLEITILPSNLIILKTIAGQKIELEMFLGSTPHELHKKMTGPVVVPPRWTLGTHICRKSADIDLDKLIADYELDHQTQFDTDCIHENILIAISITSQAEHLKKLTDILENIFKTGTKFLLNLPPQILANDSSSLFKMSKDLGILIQFNKTDYHGKYLGRKVVFPDYLHPSIFKYTEALMEYISNKIGLDNISGLVLNDNWPEDNSYTKPNGSGLPYFSESIREAMAYTLPWNILSSDNQTLQMTYHNSYGTLQNMSIHNYLQSLEYPKDLFIISATKNFGDLEPAIGENFNASWDNLRIYIERTLFNSITGNHLVGLPVCGDTQWFDQSAQETLCLRWYLAASTMPYFRVSSVKPFRDPESLNTKFSTRYALMAMERRKLLQEHYYTILRKGEPIVRPMYYDYFKNTTTFDMTSQYTIGKNLIVAHPLTLKRTKLQVYLPKTVGVWYEFWGGIPYNTTAKANEYVNINVVETDWVSFVAQGSIIPLTRNSEINFTIALNCSRKPWKATGELYIDQQFLQFVADDTKLQITNLPETCDYTVNYINVYYYNGNEGVQERISKNIKIYDVRDGNSAIIFYNAGPERDT